jgi:enoyl-CoA hydratase
MGQHWETVRLERSEDGVSVLTLDDQAHRNAINLRMRDDLAECVATVRADPDTRVLVITGAGKSFCAGANLPQIFSAEDRSVAELRDHLRRIYASFLGVRDLQVPTVAAVNGHAIGAGLNLALACDMAVAGTDAKFGATFSKIGLHPGGGCTYFLVQRLGPQRAMRLLLDGATLDAQEAVQAGLALSVHEDPLGAATEWAHEIAGRDPHLVADIKTSVGLAQQGLDATLAFEAWAQASTATKPAIQEMVAKHAKE